MPRERIIQDYQDELLARNNQAKLTDEQLLEDMRAKFPAATGKIFTSDDLQERLSILRGMRRLFNRGKHDNQRIAPPPGGVKQWDANGKVIG